MTFDIWKKPILTAALTCIALEGHAASDPNDPDCPIVNALSSIAREIDVFNTLCASGMGPCEDMLGSIQEKASPYDGLILRRIDGNLIYDPEAVGDLFGASTVQSLFDCDPEDDDCNGKTVPAFQAQQKLLEGNVSAGTIMLFPLSNFTGPRP